MSSTRFELKIFANSTDHSRQPTEFMWRRFARSKTTRLRLSFGASLRRTAPEPAKISPETATMSQSAVVFRSQMRAIAAFLSSSNSLGPLWPAFLRRLTERIAAEDRVNQVLLLLGQ